MPAELRDAAPGFAAHIDPLDRQLMGVYANTSLACSPRYTAKFGVATSLVGCRSRMVGSTRWFPARRRPGCTPHPGLAGPPRPAGHLPNSGTFPALQHPVTRRKPCAHIVRRVISAQFARSRAVSPTYDGLPVVPVDGWNRTTSPGSAARWLPSGGLRPGLAYVILAGEGTPVKSSTDLTESGSKPAPRSLF